MTLRVSLSGTVGFQGSLPLLKTKNSVVRFVRGWCVPGSVLGAEDGDSRGSASAVISAEDLGVPRLGDWQPEFVVTGVGDCSMGHSRDRNPFATPGNPPHAPLGHAAPRSGCRNQKTGWLARPTDISPGSAVRSRPGAGSWEVSGEPASRFVDRRPLALPSRGGGESSLFSSPEKGASPITGALPSKSNPLPKPPSKYHHIGD